MGSVSGKAVSLMIFGLSYSLILPLLLCIIFKKRFRAHIKPFIFGILAYGAFSFCLVNIVNGLLLGFVDPTGFSPILVFIYSLCIQFVGVILGQAGKYYVIKILKNDPNPNKYSFRGDALELGAGFGGLEMILTSGVTLMSYYSYAMLINQGQIQKILDNLTGADLESVQTLIAFITSSTPTDYLHIILQTFGIFLFQLGSTLLVYRSVFGSKAGDKAYFRLAIVLNMIIVVPSCMINAGIVTTPWFNTILTVVFGAAVLYYSYDKFKEYEKQHINDITTEQKGKKTIHLK